MFKVVGIDIDSHDLIRNKKYIIRMKDLGNIIMSRRTKHGYHYRVKLFKSVGFHRSIEIRHYLGDDSRRLINDVMRYWSGSRSIDLLFDRKWKGW